MNQPQPPPSPPDLVESLDFHTPYRRMYLLLAALSIPFILLLPAPAPIIIAVALILVLGALLLDDRWALAKIIRHDLPAFASPTRLYTVEIGLILIVLVLATRHLQNFAYDQRLSGNEFSYLINSGVIAADAYHATGTIPLWNPYMGRGEPLIENPFSFVLNPAMTLPIFWCGAVQGTKVAVLLHIGVISFGGWMLGWMLGLRTGGRLLLALLLGGCGSFVAPLGMGFYQMGLSQAYVPWVYAGLLGILLRPNQRRWTVVFAAAGVLLVFAGTFWYVLPTAIGGALLVTFHVVSRKPGTRRLVIDPAMLRRVMLAGTLLAGLAAVRLLPQAIHFDFVGHPLEFLNSPPASLLTVFRTFVSPVVVPPFVVPALDYHYLLPLEFALLLPLGRVVIAVLGFDVPARWRVVVPALLLIVLFAAWAQGGDFTSWLYQTIPLLREWRFVGRMLAAATPWVAFLVALWFDQVVGVLWGVLVSPQAALPPRWRAASRASTIIAGVALVVMLLFGTGSINSVLSNWRTRTSTETNGFLERAPLAYLRGQNPDAFLSVLTRSFFGYLPFYENRVRTTFGNPDYHPLPVAPSIGTVEQMNFLPPYALDLSSLEFLDYLSSFGFAPTMQTNGLFRPDVIWHNPNAPAYLFIVREALLSERNEPLDTSVTQAIETFTHHYDTIMVTVGGYEAGAVLVAQEVAYPGWEVTIDGETAPIESVGGLIGVRLPQRNTSEPLQVVFAYRPAWLYVGAAVSLVSLAALVILGFGLEKRVKRSAVRAG